MCLSIKNQTEKDQNAHASDKQGHIIEETWSPVSGGELWLSVRCRKERSI